MDNEYFYPIPLSQGSFFQRDAPYLPHLEYQIPHHLRQIDYPQMPYLSYPHTADEKNTHPDYPLNPFFLTSYH